ncbi:energy transducer TonB [Basilea psittacipulmonis]|uniref:energy transducer TonB n=1 Tax=Basilea psittacipulmonis TaxID=1472345 RepID=UPI000689C25E|nr:energy transducer TonB [Basilea psittacipulmonis]
MFNKKSKYRMVPVKYPWVVSGTIVLVAHILVAVGVFWQSDANVMVGTQGGRFDKEEGRSKGGEVQYIEVQEILPPPQVEIKEENFAVVAPETEVADVKKEEEKPKEPEVKPEKKPEPPPKPKPKQKPKTEKPKVAKSEKNALKGNGGVHENAGGNKGDGANDFTSASESGGYLNNPKPPYPSYSLENGEEGTVTLRVMVEADGLPSSVAVEKSSGYRRLDRSAVETVKKRYRFIPAKRAGVPVRSSYVFSIEFKID